jgi:hypothetical protein
MLQFAYMKTKSPLLVLQIANATLGNRSFHSKEAAINDKNSCKHATKQKLQNCTLLVTKLIT